MIDYKNTRKQKKSVKETPTMAKMEMPDFVKQPTVFGIYIS